MTYFSRSRGTDRHAICALLRGAVSLVLAAASLTSPTASATSSTGRPSGNSAGEATVHGFQGNPDPALQRALDSALANSGVPAVAAVVVRRSSIVAVAAAGLRRLGKEDRVTVSDRFHIGSLTKAFTATMVGRVVEAGRLSWTTTVAETFPELVDSMNVAYRGVTVAQLLAHAGGIAPYENDTPPQLPGTPSEQRRAFAARLLRGKPVFPPGTEHRYSNGGYALVAAIAERATGRAWEDLIQQEVFEPLGMHAVVGWPALTDPNQPWGHRRLALLPLRPHDPHGSYKLGPLLAPAGDLSMSVGDYGSFMQAHLLGLEGFDGLLKSSTVRRLHTPEPPPAPDTQWALGWGVQPIQGVESHVHAGSAGTFSAVVALQPSRDLGVAVFANSGDARADSLVRQLLKQLLRDYPANAARRDGTMRRESD